MTETLSRFSPKLSALILAGSCVTTLPAFAQDPVTPHSEAAPALPDAIEAQARATRLALSAGATLNTGNTRSFLGNIGFRFDMLRGAHNFIAQAQGIYGRAAQLDAETGQFSSRETNARTVTGRLRYNYFFTLRDAVFASVNTRHDRFAGLDARVQNQVGYSRMLFGDADTQYLTTEAGYDLTYDNFFEGGDDFVHSVRAYAEYMNRLTDYAQFVTGFELLYDVEEAENVRFEWITDVQTSIYESLKLGVNFTARFDNRPAFVVPTQAADKLDTITTINLIYNVDFEPPVEEPAAEAAPSCDACPSCEPQAPEAAPEAEEAVEAEVAAEEAAGEAAAEASTEAAEASAEVAAEDASVAVEAGVSAEVTPVPPVEADAAVVAP